MSARPDRRSDNRPLPRPPNTSLRLYSSFEVMAGMKAGGGGRGGKSNKPNHLILACHCLDALLIMPPPLVSPFTPANRRSHCSSPSTAPLLQLPRNAARSGPSAQASGGRAPPRAAPAQPAHTTTLGTLNASPAALHPLPLPLPSSPLPLLPLPPLPSPLSCLLPLLPLPLRPLLRARPPSLESGAPGGPRPPTPAAALCPRPPMSSPTPWPSATCPTSRRRTTSGAT